MAPKISDPYTFLRNLVARKGKSELEGVSLTAVNVSAFADVDYGYEVSEEKIEREIESIFRRDKNDWNELLVDTRLSDWEIVFPIAFHHRGEPITVFFIVEGTEMSCMVSIPKLIVDEFASEVTVFQSLLKEVSRFAGKTATTIKFSIGVVTVPWNDLVEGGDVREVEIEY